MIDIQSNGSRWAGEEPATIAELLEALQVETLDPSFEDYGNFVESDRDLMSYITGKPIYPDNPRVVRFFGNFATVSHVFNIDTDEPEIISSLSAAIRANQQTPSYQEIKRAQVAGRVKEEEERKAKEVLARF